MTKLITALIVVAVLYCGYHLFFYWKKVEGEEDRIKVETGPLRGELLPGMPYQLQASLTAVQQQGTDSFRKWLKNYGPQIQDPRRAWIELDFCVAVTREEPSEAKRVYAEVRARLAPSSPVWPRVKDLEKTYQ